MRYRVRRHVARINNKTKRRTGGLIAQRQLLIAALTALRSTLQLLHTPTTEPEYLMDNPQQQQEARDEDDNLERQYSPSQWVVRGLSPAAVVALHCRVLAEASDRAHLALPHHRQRYGPGPEQVAEWFLPPGADPTAPPAGGPVLLYIHGGYWQQLDVASSAFMAEPLAAEGATTVALGYDLCPAVTLPALVAQVESGVRAVLDRLPPSARLFLAGHSAGAHLAAWLMARLPPERRLRALLLVSGVFDLRPLVETSVNDALRLDTDTAASLSPALEPRLARGWPETRVLVAYGEHDPPAFHRQSREFVERLRREEGAKLAVEERRWDGEDHFSIIEALADPSHGLARLVREWMREDGGD